MKLIVKDIELTHDDLVRILSTATCDNPYLSVKTLKAESQLDGDSKFDCCEDRWAHRLLAGGHIVVFDYNDIDDDGNAEYYKLTLEDIKKACLTEDGQKRVMEFINEEDDFYSGYGILQCAMFGEEIYG